MPPQDSKPAHPAPKAVIFRPKTASHRWCISSAGSFLPLLPTLLLTGRPLADVSVYGVQRRTGARHKKPHVTRWSLNGHQRSRAFRTKTEAERMRAALSVAAQSGEPFDETMGKPVSWQPLPDQMRVFEWARRWLPEQWPEWAPRTWVSGVEALTRLVPLLVLPTAPPAPPGLRAHLTSCCGLRGLGPTLSLRRPRRG
jgi:hypothetical protein